DLALDGRGLDEPTQLGIDRTGRRRGQASVGPAARSGCKTAAEASSIAATARRPGGAGSGCRHIDGNQDMRAPFSSAHGRYEVKSLRVDGGRAASRWCALAGLVLLLAPVVATGGEFEDRGTAVGADGVITRANLGPSEPWPLQIERGTFVCVGKAVF